MFDEIGCTDLGCIEADDFYFLLMYAPFISMKCPSLSCLTNVNLKSTLSDKELLLLSVLGAIRLVNFLPDFHPKLVFIAVNKVGLL
jgi:hypothetical protein